MHSLKSVSRRRFHALGAGIRKAPSRSTLRTLRIEPLEQRALLDAPPSSITSFTTRSRWTAPGQPRPPLRPPSTAYHSIPNPTAYGIDTISLGGVAGTGSGQTIAIVDAYNDPNIVSDAATFNTQFGLQQFNVSGGPTLTVLNQSRRRALPAASGTSGWSVEESLDVEWAHAIAPQANIVLFEANSASMAGPDDRGPDGRGLFRRLRGFDELGRRRILRRDCLRLVLHDARGQRASPFWHRPATAVRRASIRPFRPTSSPWAARRLTLNVDNTYISETGWSGSGGGQSSYESRAELPKVGANQRHAGNARRLLRRRSQHRRGRVRFLTDFGSSSPWLQVGGTSLAAPCWAGLVAIADQIRVADGLAALNSLPARPRPRPRCTRSTRPISTTSPAAATAVTRPGWATTWSPAWARPVANKLVPDLACIPAARSPAPPRP